MTIDQLFNSFCLVGKITTVHADQIKDQLKEWEKRVREEVEKEWREKFIILTNQRAVGLETFCNVDYMSSITSDLVHEIAEKMIKAKLVKITDEKTKFGYIRRMRVNLIKR